MPNRTEADSEANERNTMDDNRSAASSVELVEEVTNIASEPITQIPESDENAVSDSPLTPLARGFIPPYISTERRQKKRLILKNVGIGRVLPIKWGHPKQSQLCDKFSKSRRGPCLPPELARTTKCHRAERNPQDVPKLVAA